MSALVAIVGRPNVGKSVLFNKIIGRRKAITKNEIGVTRDLNYADCLEGGKHFTLVDTGGFEPTTQDVIMTQVREQATMAIEDADVIVLLMDARTGATPQDKEIVELLRRTKKPVIFAANKVDTERLTSSVNEFYSLGLDKVMAVSAEHGLGLGDLTDEILSLLPDVEAKEVSEDVTKVSIVGRPNAGKSSLLNKLIGKDRAIVSEIAGTTRDSVDTFYTKDDKEYLFIDTAGIRRKNKISRRVEIYATMEAIKSIERSDVSLLVIDGKDGFKVQDERIAGLIEDRGKPAVIVVNKWDLVEKDTDTTKLYTEEIHREMPFLTHAPLVFISALTGQRTVKLFQVIERLMEQASRKVKTSVLNDMLKDITCRHTPPVFNGRPVRFYYATQTGTRPQRFTIFTNYPEAVAASYKRYLVKQLRFRLNLEEIPIRVILRKRH
jgi:GTP-binding protein